MKWCHFLSWVTGSALNSRILQVSTHENENKIHRLKNFHEPWEPSISGLISFFSKAKLLCCSILFFCLILIFMRYLSYLSHYVIILYCIYVSSPRRKKSLFLLRCISILVTYLLTHVMAESHISIHNIIYKRRFCFCLFNDSTIDEVASANIRHIPNTPATRKK